MRIVSKKIKNSIEPRIYPEVKKVIIDGKDCIYVKFEGNNTPYFASGVARIRVADKDYSTGQSNEVAIYKDRIEIYNPGAFPEGFEPQDFIDRPERPIRRNPKIARILYYSNDIESFGTGLKRIAEACNNAGVEYEFKKLKSGFVVCLYRSQESGDKVGKNKASNEALKKAGRWIVNDSLEKP